MSKSNTSRAEVSWDNAAWHLILVRGNGKALAARKSLLYSQAFDGTHPRQDNNTEAKYFATLFASVLLFWRGWTFTESWLFLAAEAFLFPLNTNVAKFSDCTVNLRTSSRCFSLPVRKLLGHLILSSSHYHWVLIFFAWRPSIWLKVAFEEKSKGNKTIDYWKEHQERF